MVLIVWMVHTQRQQQRRTVMTGIGWTSDAAWTPEGGCSPTSLGACQPVKSRALCRNLCSSTLGCIGWTFVRPPYARNWEAACLRSPPQSHIALNDSLGRCCLEQHLPAALRQPATCCDAGQIDVSFLCREGCRAPWPNATSLDNLAASKIDAQRRHQHGGPLAAEAFPWVPIQQRVELRLRRQAANQEGPGASDAAIATTPHAVGAAPSLPRPPQQRIAVCVAGAARAFVHPAVGYSFERFVLPDERLEPFRRSPLPCLLHTCAYPPTAHAEAATDRALGHGFLCSAQVLGASGAAITDVYVAIGTGDEDHRAVCAIRDSNPRLASSSGALQRAPLVAQSHPGAVCHARVWGRAPWLARQRHSAAPFNPPLDCATPLRHSAAPLRCAIRPRASDPVAHVPSRAIAQRTNLLPMDDMSYVRSAEGAAHLAHAIARLRPVAVWTDTSVSSAACRTPATGQFAKVAKCLELARTHERRHGFKYDMLVRTRPDILWHGPVLSGRVSLDALSAALHETAELHHTVIGADDMLMIAPRTAWRAVEALRPEALKCAPLCSKRYWEWMRGLRTHCLLKAAFASAGIHHVDLLGAAALEDVLHARQLPSHAPPLRVQHDGGFAWRDWEGSLAGAPPLPADQLRLGQFSILRAGRRTAHAPSQAPVAVSAIGVAVTCAYGERGECAAPLPRCAPCLTADWDAKPPLLAHPGYCEGAEGEGDCQRGMKGAWDTGGAGEAGGFVGLPACIRRCEACARCRFLSFSLHLEDCTWTYRCNLSKLTYVADNTLQTFRTVQVRYGADGALRRAEIAPPAGAARCPTQTMAAWNPDALRPVEGGASASTEGAACTPLPASPAAPVPAASMDVAVPTRVLTAAPSPARRLTSETAGEEPYVAALAATGQARAPTPFTRRRHGGNATALRGRAHAAGAAARLAARRISLGHDTHRPEAEHGTRGSGGGPAESLAGGRGMPRVWTGLIVAFAASEVTAIRQLLELACEDAYAQALNATRRALFQARYHPSRHHSSSSRLQSGLEGAPWPSGAPNETVLALRLMRSLGPLRRWESACTHSDERAALQLLSVGPAPLRRLLASSRVRAHAARLIALAMPPAPGSGGHDHAQAPSAGARAANRHKPQQGAADGTAHAQRSGTAASRTAQPQAL